jgi:hypothetical protein
MSTATPEQTAARVKARLTETPEQRRERVIQEFMAEHGYEALTCTTPDDRQVTYLSPAARERETRQRNLAARIAKQQGEAARRLQQARAEMKKEAIANELSPFAVWDSRLGRRIA